MASEEADLELWDLDIAEPAAEAGHWNLTGYTWDPVHLTATRKPGKRAW